MIIDSHTHLGRNEHIKANVGGLLESMDGSKIDKSLVFAGELNGLSTHQMLEEIKPHCDRLYGVASWNFDWPLSPLTPVGMWQDEYLSKLYQAGDIVAVKFYTGYYHKMPSDLSFALETLNKIGCPAIFHCGDCLNSVKCAKLKYAHPLNIDEVAVDYPNMNFIIAHIGYPWVKDTAEVCYKNKNVFTDISGFVYGEFNKDDVGKFGKTLQEFLDIADSNKLLFGTDWPIASQRSYLETLDYLANIAPSLKMSEIFSPQYMTQNTIKAFNLNVKTEGKNQR